MTGIAGDPGLLVAPGIPATVDRATRVTLVGEEWFGGARVDGARSYAATADVPVVTDGVDDALTENRLRAAGADYPPRIRGIYLNIQPDTAGAQVKALLDTILEATKPRTPYDTARAIETWLSDPEKFQYQTNVLDVDCGGLGVADCFAVTKVGYCQHFATTMVMMLRLQGIPARLVQGYLPADARRGRHGDDPQVGRARLGGGLLPGIRLGGLRSHRGRGPAAGDSRGPRPGHADPRAQRRGRHAPADRRAIPGTSRTGPPAAPRSRHARRASARSSWCSSPLRS